MAIKLSGAEAVNQAYYAENNEGLTANSHLYFEQEGQNVSLSPQKALQLVKDGTIEPETLTCEVQSVWDLLQANEIDNTVLIHRCPNTVLVLTRDYGAEIGGGIRGFAVLASGYENAVRWAMNSPAIDLDFDRDEFIVRLHPRMLLRNGAWRQDVDLLRHGREIANALIEVFDLDTKAIWKEVQDHSAPYHEGEPLFHGGNLLDTVLAEVRKTIDRDPLNMVKLRTKLD